MATAVKEVPGFNTIAAGNSRQVPAGNPIQYLVAQIAPYPNDDLIVGNTYSLSGPNHTTGLS